MLRKLAFGAFLLAAIVFSASCGGDSQRLEVDESMLSEEALAGKKIFERKECMRCHIIGKENKTVVDQIKEVVVPDLANPLIANDSIYIQVHFKLLNESEMPGVALTPDETAKVSKFLAEVHAAAYTTTTPEEADQQCNVCGALVNQAEAKEKGLSLSYLGYEYYFECEDCKYLFTKAPQAFTQ